LKNFFSLWLPLQLGSLSSFKRGLPAVAFGAQNTAIFARIDNLRIVFLPRPKGPAMIGFPADIGRATKATFFQVRKFLSNTFRLRNAALGTLRRVEAFTLGFEELR
jgi:hypothetical protein